MNKNNRNKGKFYIREIFIRERKINEAMQSKTEYVEKMKVKIWERNFVHKIGEKKNKDCRSYMREMSIELTGTSLLFFSWTLFHLLFLFNILEHLYGDEETLIKKNEFNAVGQSSK